MDLKMKINKIKSNGYLKSNQKRCPLCGSELNIVIDLDKFDSFFKSSSKLNAYFRSHSIKDYKKSDNCSLSKFNLEENVSYKNIIVNEKRFVIYHRSFVNKILKKKYWIGSGIKCNCCEYFQYTSFEKI